MNVPENFLERYNPLGAASLSEDELQGMQSLSTDQIKALAQAYPNQPRGNNYLVLVNKNLTADKQVYQLSTWNNLYTLHTLGKKEFAAFSFKSVFDSPQYKKPATTKPSAPKKAVVVDLSKEDVAGAPGIKTSIPSVIAPSTENANVQQVETEPNSDELVAAIAEVSALEAELKQAQDDKAHHMTIKSIETKVDAAKQKVAELTK